MLRTGSNAKPRQKEVRGCRPRRRGWRPRQPGAPTFPPSPTSGESAPPLTAVIPSDPKASRRIFPFPPARRLFRCVTLRPYRRDGYQPSARNFLRPAPPRANPHPCTCLSPRRGEVLRSEVEGPLDPHLFPSQSLRDSSPLPCGGASQVGFLFLSLSVPSFSVLSPFFLFTFHSKRACCKIRKKRKNLGHDVGEGLVPSRRGQAVYKRNVRRIRTICYPHRAVSMGMICFFRDMIPPMNTRLSLGVTEKAC